jgi:hypothetical protein
MVVANTIICVLLVLALIAALTHKYLVTRDIGFVWLGIAIVVWPFVTGALHQRWFIEWIMVGHDGNVGAAYTEVAMSVRVIELVLQLMAVLYLCRKAVPKPVA